MVKILFLPNWRVEYCNTTPIDKQPPDYYVKNRDYWFFRYFAEKPYVDVIDIKSNNWLEKTEKNIFRFYIFQALKAIPRLNNYDLVVSHGMQSGIVIALWRRLFKTRSKHIVFDIGSFNSAAESGLALKLMQHASKSIDGIIYHTSSQIKYYERFFPWIVKKSQFIKYGADYDFFKKYNSLSDNCKSCEHEYCICVGYSKRDWDTLFKAFQNSKITGLKLLMVGHVDEKYNDISNIEQIEYVTIDELMRLVNGAKFSILPLKSFNYSYGQMTLMQQMAIGKCVIAAKVPSLADYGENKENIVFYEPENVDELAQTIKYVNSDSDFRHKLEKNAKKYVEKENNEKTMAREIERVFMCVLKNGI